MKKPTGIKDANGVEIQTYDILFNPMMEDLWVAHEFDDGTFHGILHSFRGEWEEPLEGLDAFIIVGDMMFGYLSNQKLHPEEYKE